MLITDEDSTFNAVEYMAEIMQAISYPINAYTGHYPLPLDPIDGKGAVLQ